MSKKKPILNEKDAAKLRKGISEVVAEAVAKPQSHTPGPWKADEVEGDIDGLTGRKTFYVTRGFDEFGGPILIALVRSSKDDGITYEEAEANARLIAAAPDANAANIAALEVLEMLIQDYDLSPDQAHDAESTTGRVDRAVKMLRAAIAKAEAR